MSRTNVATLHAHNLPQQIVSEAFKVEDLAQQVSAVAKMIELAMGRDDTEKPANMEDQVLLASTAIQNLTNQVCMLAVSIQEHARQI